MRMTEVPYVTPLLGGFLYLLRWMHGSFVHSTKRRPQKLYQNKGAKTD